MKFLVLMMIMAAQATVAPRLSISSSPSKTILIDRVPAGATGACLIFKSEDELVNGEPWAPRHCFWFTSAVERYQEDWDFITPGHNYEMWVEVYLDPDVTIESNHLHEAH